MTSTLALSPVLALTVRPPWSHWLARGIKNIENRAWAPPDGWRGMLVIHAGKTLDLDGFWFGARLGHPVVEDEVNRGEYLAVADLVDVHRAGADCRPTCIPWGQPDCFHWVLRLCPPPCHGRRARPPQAVHPARRRPRAGTHSPEAQRGPRQGGDRVSSETKIEWTDHTFNPWWGCSRVSPACRSCYADATATRWGHELWRRKGPRRMLSEANWRTPLKWNRAAEAAGQRLKVFCASMADVFEIHPVDEVNAQLDTARARLWSLIEQTPWLEWQLLTKRPENVAELVPWVEEWPANVWLGTSVEDNRRATERIPVLLLTTAKTLFLSCEPLLEDVDLGAWFNGDPSERRRPDWVIAGGESGPKARPMHPAWARSLRDQCQAANVAFFFKQWGEWAPAGYGVGCTDPRERLIGPSIQGPPAAPAGQRGFEVIRRVGKKAAGRELDGEIYDQFPEFAANPAGVWPEAKRPAVKA